MFEAFRFNPVNPLIYRRATCDATIAAGSLRARKIPTKGTMVLVLNLSAMFDPLKIEAPGFPFASTGRGANTCSGDTGCTRVSALISTAPSCR